MRARDNPYTVQHIHRLRYRMTEPEWVELLVRCEKLRFRGALVGPHGHGKTTLLNELSNRLSSNGWRVRRETLHRGDRRIPEITKDHLLAELSSNDLVVLDGAEQLDRREWRWFRHATRQGGGLLITSHRRGLLPTLKQCGTSSQLLAELMNELHCSVECRQPSAAELWKRHHGNVREALWELYDWHAQETNCANLEKGFGAPMNWDSKIDPMPSEPLLETPFRVFSHRLMDRLPSLF